MDSFAMFSWRDRFYRCYIMLKRILVTFKLQWLTRTIRKNMCSRKRKKTKESFIIFSIALIYIPVILFWAGITFHLKKEKKIEAFMTIFTTTTTKYNIIISISIKFYKNITTIILWIKQYSQILTFNLFFIQNSVTRHTWLMINLKILWKSIWGF